MAGMLAARVLAERFERVTIVERDRYPEGAENRRGVPQGRHTHGLLASGREIIERLFPGISVSLLEAGAVPCDVCRDGYWFQQGGPLARVASGLDGFVASRPLIEAAVRERVRRLENVRVVEDCAVEGLLTGEGRVTGVRTARGPMEADLVVDASGRGSRAPGWLSELGYEKAEEERVEIALAYTTRWFRRDPDCGAPPIVVIPPTPDGKRGGVMLAQEGGRWTVTLIGHFGHAAPEELDGFIDYSGTLPSSLIHDVIRQAEPLSEPMSARFPASVRRRYERLTRFPEGFLVAGDAVCSFNPAYGQGMTAAAFQALELGMAIDAGWGGLARRFFAGAAKVVDIPWSIAVGNDLRMPETVGPRPATVRFINWYVAKLHVAAHRDAVCSTAFHRVANLLEPPPSIMKPAVAWRVLRASLRRGEEAQGNFFAGSVSSASSMRSST